MKIKKLFLKLGIALTLVVGAIVGVIGVNASVNNASKANKAKEVVGFIEEAKKITPKYYRYAPNSVKIMEGEDNLNYSYSPSANASKVETKLTQDSNGDYIQDIEAAEGEPIAIAYEYAFGNTMDRVAAVNLKSIDTTGVNVSYAWSYTRLDKNNITEGLKKSKFELQKLDKMGDANDWVYLYIIVSPQDASIPTTFTRSIVWWYGIPQEISIQTNVGSTSSAITIVANQQVTNEDLPTPTAPASTYGKDAYATAQSGYDKDEYPDIEEGRADHYSYSVLYRDVEFKYYFDGWFWDSEFTQPADLSGGVQLYKPIYARFHNLPIDNPKRFTITEKTDGTLNFAKAIEHKIEHDGDRYFWAMPENLVLPTSYNGKTLTSISAFAFNYHVNYDGYSYWNDYSDVRNVSLPYTITSIGSHAFTLAGFENIDLSNCINLKTIESYAFGATENGRRIDPETALKTITLPASVETIGDYAFYYCTGLETVNFAKNNNLQTLGEYAFSNCSSLVNINLEDCDNLTRIGVEAIDACCFEECSSLTSIVIPEKVNFIGHLVFLNCTSLTSITFEDTEGWWYDTAEMLDVTNPANNAYNMVSIYDGDVWSGGSWLGGIGYPMDKVS